MRITRLETFLANSGLRNYLFLRLTTDAGLTGIGEASLEWQERAVQTLVREWLEERVLGIDPRDLVTIVDNLIRDQYQGGPTVLTAISGVEIAMWDILGKAEGKPVYELLGGRAHEQLPAYANGWYGGAYGPEEYAEKAQEVVDRGYRALKFDPFGTAWREMSQEEMGRAAAIVAAVRRAVGEEVEVCIEAHGRFSVQCAIEMGHRLEAYRPAFYEEPVTPHSLDQLEQVKEALPLPIAAGERLYSIEEFERCCSLRACHILQPDLAHCGGLHVGQRIAAMAEASGIRISPHVSVGPVALCAALHFDLATPNFLIQENFSEYDVPWRNDFVCGWDPIRQGEFDLAGEPGLGIELNMEACAVHPYRKSSFPSLWDERWLADFTQKDKEAQT